MSLTTICVIVAFMIVEFATWFYFSHDSNRPIDRAWNLQFTGWTIACLGFVYYSLWVIRDQTPFIDPMPVLWIAGFNAVIAVIITSLLVITRPTHRRS